MPRITKFPLPSSSGSKNRQPPSKRQRASISVNKTSSTKKRKTKANKHPLEDRPIPVEVLANIFSFLDSTVDRGTLVSLTTVSQAFFDAAAPVLYGHLAITETQLHQLVVNGLAKKHQKHAFRHLRKLRSQGVSRLSSSSQRALQHIVRLELLSRPSNATIEALWASTIPNIPLFPNVRWLRIDHSVRAGELQHDPPRYPIYPLDDDVVLFDAPNVCCRGDMDLLDYLPTLSARSLTTHTSHANRTMSRLPHSPINARPFRVFQLIAAHVGEYGQPKYWADDSLIREMPKPPRTLCINMPSAKFFEEAMAKYQWRPSDKTENLEFIENIEPCAVCGRTWDDEATGSGVL